MHSFKPHSLTMILLSAYAVIMKASGISDLQPKRLRPERANQLRIKRPNTERFLTNGPLSETNVLFYVKGNAQNFRSTAKSGAYSEIKRSRRFADNPQTLEEENIDLDNNSNIMRVNEEKSTQISNSTEGTDTAEKPTQKDPKVTFYKDPNRTRRIKQVQRQMSPERDTSSHVTPKAELPSRTKNPLDTERNLTKTAHEMLIKDEVITELTKSKNRPPWLSQIPDDLNSDDHNNKGTKKVTSIAKADNITALDSMSENITVTHLNSTNLSSLPGITNAPQSKSSSLEVDEQDELTTPTSQQTTPIPRKGKRRRIRHEKNKGKRLNYNKMYPKTSKSRQIKDNVSKKSRKLSPTPLGPTANITKETEYNSTQEPLKQSILKNDSQHEDAEGNKEESSDDDDCPTCRKKGLTEDEVKKLRMGMFQDLLMKKLRIDPEQLIVTDKDIVKQMNASIPKLPPSLIEQTYKDNINSREEEKEEFYAQDQEVVLPGTDMGRNCIDMHATGCYIFDFEGKVKGDVASAELWLYKMRDATDISGQNFIVYELEKARNGQLMRRNLIVRKDTFTKEDWVSMNVTRAVKRWIEKRRGRTMLALRCKTCATRNHKALYGTKHGYKPLLVIKYANDMLMRRKRSTEECDPSIRCCKRSLVANFRALNMPFILSPANLSVGYCFGFCERIDLFTHNHTVIKQNMRLTTMSGNSDMREQLKPCCVPRLLKDTFIMTYRDGFIVRTLLPKVIVEECECL